MEQIFLSLTQSEFENIIRDCVRNELKTYTPAPPPQDEDELLTTAQARDFLKVSKVTIHKWKTSGKIKFHRIGTRIRFYKSELLSALNPSKNFTRNEN